jgi:hypothetical protein
MLHPPRGIATSVPKRRGAEEVDIRKVFLLPGAKICPFSLLSQRGR